MGKRAAVATSSAEAQRLSPAELDRQIAFARWRLGAATKSTLRNSARKHLAMLKRVKGKREAAHGDGGT